MDAYVSSLYDQVTESSKKLKNAYNQMKNPPHEVQNLVYEVEGMPISEKQIEALVRIERNDIGFGAEHAIEGTGCAAMESGVGSPNADVVEDGGESLEPLIL